MSKICKYIIPESTTNPDAEVWEYFLVWIAPDGGVLCWLFEDFTKKVEVSGEIINQKTDNITKIFKGANQTIQLVAEDLTENEFDTLSDIIRAKDIRRYFRDGSYKKVAIVSTDFEKPKSQFRYNLLLEIQEKDKAIYG